MKEIIVTDCRVQPGDCAFLIDDGTTSVLHDTGFGFTGFEIAGKVEKALGGRPLNYILLSHSHYDHALATPCVKRKYPGAIVVAGRYAADIFQRPGAKRVMRELDGKFAATCGVLDYECLADELSVDVMVDNGDIVKAGDMEFEVINLPGHTKCSVGYYCRSRKMLLSSESLGVYDGGKVILPSYLVSRRQSLESMDRVLAMDIEAMLAPHLGLLSREQTEFFLAEMKPQCIEISSWICGLIGKGLDDSQIISEFIGRFWNGTIKEMYPIDALKLNTSIMIGLLRKEMEGTGALPNPPKIA